jgi:hypothetical protein
MLKSLDDKVMTSVPHPAFFLAAKKQLGPLKVTEVCDKLNELIDQMQPDNKTQLRTFSSSYLGSELSPWQHPLSHLYHVARVIEGQSATEKEVQDRAALLFGQFIWECVMSRQNETWVFYDPNLGSRDPNKAITGKVYFERS